MVSIGFHSQAQNLESPFLKQHNRRTESTVFDSDILKDITLRVKNYKQFCSIINSATGENIAQFSFHLNGDTLPVQPESPKSKPVYSMMKQQSIA